MSTNTVWVIEQGEYSDYRVLGVFSSQAHAQRIADAMDRRRGYDAATVAEWPLDPAIDDLQQGHVPFLIMMLKDGTVERCEEKEVGFSSLAGDVQMWRRSKAPANAGKGIPDVLMATVWAKDDVHAIKIVNEHRARMIATGEWESSAVAAHR